MRRWLTRLFYGGLLGFILLVVILYGCLGTPTGTRWVLRSAAHLSHGKISFTSSHGSLLYGLTIDGLRWHSASLEIRIGQADLRWRPLDLLTGRLMIETLTARHVLVIRHSIPSSSTPPIQPNHWVEWTLPPLTVRMPSLDIEDIHVETDGRTLHLSRIRGNLGSSGRRLALRSLVFVTPHAGLTITGNILLTPSPKLDLDTLWHWRRPDGSLLDGQGKLQGPLTRLAVAQRLTRPFKANVTGTIDIPLLTGSIHLAWKKAHWPLSGEPQITSAAGILQATGGLNAYHLTLSATSIKRGAIAISKLEAKANGDRRGLTLKPLQATLLGGHIEATGQLAWHPILSWQLDLTGQALNPGQAIHNWPGKLKLALQLTGNRHQIRFTLRQLDGLLRQQPVKAYTAGTIGLSKHMLTLAPTHLSVLGATLDVSGQVATADGALQFLLSVPSLKAFNPTTGGHLTVSGRLSGPWTWPQIHGRIEGGQLAFRTLHITRLEGAINPAAGRQLAAQLKLNGITRGRIHLDRIQLDAVGLPSAHQLSIEVQSPRAHLAMALKGGIRKAGAAWQRWQGQLTRLDLKTQDVGDWQLDHPTELGLSRQQVTLAPVCLKASHKPATHICAHFVSSPSKVQMRVEWSQIPLTLLDSWLPPALQAGGYLSGNASLSGPIDALQGNLSARAPNAYIETRHNGSRQHYALPLNKLSVTLHPHEAGVALKAGLPGKGELDGQLIAGLNPRTTLHGQVHANIPDLAFINPLVPNVQDIAGMLEGELTFSGTRAAPKVGVQIALSKGAFTLPQTGIHLSDIQATLSGQPTDKTLQVEVQAHSGPGQIKATGWINNWLSRAPLARLTVSGQHFEAVNLPQIRAQISPKLSVEAHPKFIRVRGQLEVPEASITIKHIPASAVNVSSDTRIVGAGAPPTTQGLQPDIDVELALGQKVKVDALGLKGRLTGNLLLRQKGEAPATADGVLRIVNGTYAAYGLNLNISRGVLNFAGPVGNPGLDIVAQRQTGDVTAQLTVNGTLKAPRSQVSATPPMSESEALSWLITGHGLAGASKSDVALLVKTMASMQLDQGTGNGGLMSSLKSQTGLNEISVQGGETLQQSALLLGKYLTPDLYVRYATGLFERSNTLTLNYRMSQHVSVEATSGTAQGIDLLYQIVFGPR